MDALPALHNFEEEVLEMDPFEERFTFTVADDVLTLTVDEPLAARRITP